MKLFIIFAIMALTSQVQAKDVKDFNKELIQDVQNDFNNHNDFNLKANKAPMRGPASVGGELEIEEPKSKVQIKDKQIGPNKW
jgi:hypothetical protein